MKKKYILFIFTFLSIFLGLSQDDDCIVEAGFQMIPAPDPDPEFTGLPTWPSETTVQFCYEVEEYNTPETQNWMHGIVPLFGPGWDLSTLQPVGQPEAQTNFGEWIWIGDVVAGITGELISSSGWWYDSTQGSGGASLDGDPSNNWGDGNNGPWEFCWEITTHSCPPALNGTSLIIEILNFADSETGSWNNSAALNQCIDDPSYFIQAELNCPTCDESGVTTVNPTCETLNTTGGVAAISPGGVGPWNYIWFNLDSGEIIQENNNVVSPGFVTISGLDPGNYMIQVEDLGFAGGCASGELFQILPPEAILVEFDVEPTTCLDSSDGSIVTASIMNENCIDEESIPEVIDTSLCESAEVPVCGCDFITYINSCYAETFYGITSYEDGACPDTNSSYSISWSSDNSISGSGTEITDLLAGDYEVLVECIDNTSPVFGCSFESVVTVTAPDPLNFNSTISDNNTYGVSCNGACDGTIDVDIVGGTGFEVDPEPDDDCTSYDWVADLDGDGVDDFFASNTNLDALCIGTYNLIATDCHNCITSTTFELTEPDILEATFSISNYNGFGISCNGGSDGSIDLIVTGGVGPYTFDWSDGSSEQNLNNVSSGTYSVLITCANDCELILDDLVLTEPNSLEITNSTTQGVSCFDDSDGSIGITVEGGVEEYDYEWSNGAISEDLLNIEAGDYTVLITCANGCEYQETFNVSTPDLINISESIDNISCLGEDDGFIDLNVFGGTPFSAGLELYEYDWDNGSTAQFINNLIPGFYTVTVTDSQGCFEIETYEIEEPTLLEAAVSQVIDVDCFGENTGSVNSNIEGGTEPYDYSWSNGSTSANLSNVSADTYSLTVTDNNGCVDVVLNIQIDQPSSLLEIDATVIHVTCFGGNDGSIIPEPFGGTPPYSTQNLYNLSADTYTVYVEDSNGCVEQKDYTITEPSEILANLDVEDVDCYGLNNGEAESNTSGGTPPYTYLWSNGAASESITGLYPGDYFVNIEDAVGCQITELFVISEPNSNDFEITSLGLISCLEEFEVSVVSALSSFTGSWSGSGAGTVSFSNPDLSSTDVTVSDYGYYQLIFTDDCGEEIVFDFEMSSITPLATADPYVQYCSFEVDLEAYSSDGGFWTLVSPSNQELQDNNTDVHIDDWDALNTTATVMPLDPLSSEECCYGEYVFKFESCGAEDLVTVYFGKEAPEISISTHEPCVLDGQIYLNNPISFYDALIDPGYWAIVGGPVDALGDFTAEITYETPHEVGVSASGYGIYYLEYEICDTTHRTSIGFSCPLTLPNVFTPNGDGNNDFFASTELVDGVHEQVNFTVYNRFGTIVHAQSDWSPVNSILWDGTTNTFQDRKLSDGVYFYTLELFNRASKRKEMYDGYIHLFGEEN